MNDQTLECGCPDTSLERVTSFLDNAPGEDAMTACVVAGLNASRPRASLRRLLEAFIPQTPELAWIWQAFDTGAHFYGQLLTGPSRPDMLIVVDRGPHGPGVPEIAAIVEAKIGAEFNVPALRDHGIRRWVEVGLRPHLKLWRTEAGDEAGVPQTDTYALFGFETDACAPGHAAPAPALYRHPMPTSIAHRILYPQHVAAAAATEPSVTGHLWQTTSFTELANALIPATPPTLDTHTLAWDRTFAEVLRRLVDGKGRHKAAPKLPGVTPAQVRAAAAAAVVVSKPLTGAEQVSARPLYNPGDNSLDFLYGLQVDWDNRTAASAPLYVLRYESFREWSYTLVPTAYDWRDEAGRTERDETTGRPFRSSYDELAHRFVLREGNTMLRRLEVHAGIGHAARFGFREDEEVLRLWPDGFPTAAGHLVVRTHSQPHTAPATPPDPGLRQALASVLAQFGAVPHDVRSVTSGERIWAWFTYPPLPDGDHPCPAHPQAGSCQHTTTGQMLQVAMRALPVVADYAAWHGLDQTDPYPVSAAYQD